MPNWCHNTLTVQGESDELARFIEAVKPQESWLREIFKEWAAKEKPAFEEYFAEYVANNPLSFASLIPQPSDEELRELETYQPCTMCGARGTLPESPEQAEERGAKWFAWMGERENRTCNVCGGSKEERVGMEGWYEWRTSNWGSKWDASFDGPFMALSAGDETDLDASVETQGATVTPTVAVYKFDTAWSPPGPFVLTASERFPELEFVLRYGEPGNGYAGQIKCVAGVTVEDEELEVEDVLAPEEMWF